MAVTKTELRKVITKLDDVKIELLRLRADLLPEERSTASKKREIEQGRREIERGPVKMWLRRLESSVSPWEDSGVIT